MTLTRKDDKGDRAASNRQAKVRRGVARKPRPASATGGQVQPRRDTPWVRPAYRRRTLFLRKLLTGLLAAVLLVSIAVVTNSFRMKKYGATVLAEREIPSVPVFFYQKDAAWASDRLGTSQRTLGEAGDSVSCLASLIAMQQLPTPIEGEVNPGSLNAWLSENGAWDDEGSLNWPKAASLLGVSLVERQPGWGISRTLELQLQREVYPVARVKQPGTDAFHDVLLVGSVHGEFAIMDPLDASGEPNPLSIYNNRIYAVRYLK